MKKWVNKSLIIGCISLMSFTTLYASPSISPVNDIVLAEDDGKPVTDAATGVTTSTMPTSVITGDGVFTNYETGNIKCSYTGKDKLEEQLSAENKTGTDYSKEKDDTGFIMGALIDMVLGLITGITNWLSGELCDPTEDAGLGFLAQMTIFAKPVNLTTSQGLMSVTGIVQWMSMIIMIFGLLYYGYRYMHPSVFKWIDPMQMIFKFFVAMILVYWAPYFLQDIININNILVTTLSGYIIPLGGVNEAGEAIANASVQAILPMAFVSFVHGSIGDGATWMGLIDAIIMLIVVILCIIPMMSLICWWYIRLIKLYIYTAISPIFFAQMVTDSKKTSQFIMNFTREVFSQFFVVVGILVIGAFIGEIPSLVKEATIGVLGLGLALWAALSFVKQLPDLAGGLFEGQVDGPSPSAMASGVGKAAGGVALGAAAVGITGAAVGAKAAGGLARAGASGMVRGAQGLQRAGRAVSEKGFKQATKDGFNAGVSKVGGGIRAGASKVVSGGKTAVKAVTNPVGSAKSAINHIANNGDKIKESVGKATSKTGDLAGKLAVGATTAAVGTYKLASGQAFDKNTNGDKILRKMKEDFGQQKKGGSGKGNINAIQMQQPQQPQQNGTRTVSKQRGQSRPNGGGARGGSRNIRGRRR